MSERQLPTPGDWRIWYVSPHGRPYIIADDRPIIAQVYRYSVAYGGLPAEANAALIAAAGTAAHACEQLGYDGTRAIEALPGLLEAVAALHVEEAAYIGDADYPNYAQTTLSMPAGHFRRVLAALAALAAAKPEGAA